MNDGLKGIRGHHPILTHPDVVPVPSHVWTHELGEKVPIMSNSPNQWVAKTGMCLRVTVGSGVHGMAIAGTDDDDHMAVFVEPPEYVIGSKRIENYNFRTQPEGVCSGPDDLDLVAYSLRKFIRLAAQGNPTVLIPLFVPEADVLYINDFGRELRANRHLFISKQAGARFRGYLESQRRGLMGLRSGGTRNQGRRDYRAKYSFDVKFAAHMIRLGVQGIELLKTGLITLPIPEPDLTYLRDLKTGGFLGGAEPGSALWKSRGDAKKNETLARAELLKDQIDALMPHVAAPRAPRLVSHQRLVDQRPPKVLGVGMTAFSFDVTVSSHDLLKRGICEARLPGSPHHHHRIVIESEDRDDAALTAAQMAACIPGVMVTGVYDRI